MTDEEREPTEPAEERQRADQHPSEKHRAMTAEANPHDWYAALNGARQEAREHTDALVAEVRNELREDRREILDALNFGRQELLRELVASRQELKQDIIGVRQELKQDIGTIRQELGDVRLELKQDVSGLRTELKQDVADAETRLARQIATVMAELSTTRAELHRDIQRVQDTAEANTQEIIKIKTFGRAAVLFLSIVGVFAAIAAAIAAFN